MCRAAGSSKVELITSQLRPFDLPLHVGDFFRPLVDQEHEDVQVGIVRQRRLGHLLHEDRLAGPRRADDQPALAEADRHDQVDHPHARSRRRSVSMRIRSSGCSGVRSSKETLSDSRFGILVVDRLDPQQGEVALVFLGRADLARDRRPGLQAEAANLAGRNVNVVGAGEVVVVGAAEEAEAVGQDFQRPLAVHQPVELHPLLEDLEDQVLLLDAGVVGEVFLAGLLDQLGHRHPLQLGDVGVAGLLDLLVAVVDVVGQALGARRRSPRPALQFGDVRVAALLDLLVAIVDVVGQAFRAGGNLFGQRERFFVVVGEGIIGCIRLLFDAVRRMVRFDILDRISNGFGILGRIVTIVTMRTRMADGRHRSNS